jgi:uncharacterized protein (TIGR03067 family)
MATQRISSEFSGPMIGRKATRWKRAAISDSERSPSDPRHVVTRSLQRFGYCLIGWLCIALSASSLVADEPDNDERQIPLTAEKAKERLQGAWRIIEGVNSGKKLPEEKLEGTSVAIKDDSILVLDGKEEQLHKAKFHLVTAVRPFQIRMQSFLPDGTENESIGIFKFTEKGWQLCYGLPGKSKPEKFAAPEGSGYLLFKLEPREIKEQEPGELSEPATNP